MDLDKSTLMYLPLRLPVRKPSDKTRASMFLKFVEADPLTDLSNEQMMSLIKQTEHMSVFEMKAFLSYCLVTPLRDLHDERQSNIDADLRFIEYEDFVKALRYFRPITCNDLQREQEEWSSRYASKVS